MGREYQRGYLGTWEPFELSTPFFCKSKAALENEVYKLKQNKTTNEVLFKKHLLN